MHRPLGWAQTMKKTRQIYVLIPFVRCDNLVSQQWQPAAAVMIKDWLEILVRFRMCVLQYRIL